MEHRFPPKDKVKSLNSMQQSEHQDAADAKRVILVDENGDPYNSSNALPVTGGGSSNPASLILGILSLPTLVNQFVAPLVYDQVISSTVGNVETLTFYEGGVPVDELTLTKTPAGWILDLGFSTTEEFLLLESGAFFDLEDNSGWIKLE